MDDQDQDAPLTGGRMTPGVVRRRDTVRRPLGPWSPAVHELLRHVEATGFDGAPRVIAVEESTEVLTYIDGDVPADPGWQPGMPSRLPAYVLSDDAIIATGELLRRLHDTLDGFRPTETSYRFHPHPPGRDEIVSHGDLGPWNTVYRGGLPVAFIDWDSAQPTEPLIELASAAWSFIPLGPNEPPGGEQRRLRLLVDAYGLDDRPSIITALKDCKLISVQQFRHWNLRPADSASALEYRAAELRWLQTVVGDLSAAL
ncbi:phosphotransferase family enzyme [Pseudonocardia kunmingensis]|uniref:Phosphotransferase family enzyme n=1 Tax=Pseudonocardia kunmingensis TaxID=630975 RepID=A0A543DB20_9PSEU|nr:phosphotransferase family enzyme [Pseudonocardia kunmingensis]